MRRFHLSRRAVLRGAGSVAIALPWLEVMAPERPARAAQGAAKRFVTVFTPGGTVLENWRPSGSEKAFKLGAILKPLAPVQDRLMIVDGLDMKAAQGEQDQAGMVGWLTGSAQEKGLGGFATGPSIDQVLAKSLASGFSLQSLQMAVRWGTGKSHGLPSPINIANYADTPAFDPIPPLVDPVAIWQKLFGRAAQPSPDAAWDKSILDAVGRRYAKLAERLGASDRQRLEEHLTSIRKLETRVAGAQACAPPALVDTSDYDPFEGLNSDDRGTVRDLETDAAIPKVGKLMIDMLVMALACGITPVASLQWSDTEAKHTFPWLGLPQHLHYYMNDGGYQPAELTTIFTWYSTQHAYLIQELARVTAENGRSLLDDTVIFFGSQLQNPATYAKTDMPFLLAGNGGGLRTNRWVQNNHASHNDLLVSLLNLFGDTRKTFGDPRYCDGPLGGLT